MTEANDIFVPVTNIKNEIPPKRIKQLLEFFQQEYKTDPEFFVRVPGRINIIGEHVDYCGFPVFPMAIEQSILLAVSKVDNNFLQLRNQDEKYERFKTSLDLLNIEFSTNGSPKWSSYFLCGVKGILEYVGINQLDNGLMVAVSGNIPPASGLSSSSALVSSAVLATAYLTGLSLNAKILAEIAANCERYIGTQGGGMDQAIAFLAKSGCAQFIEFHPILNSKNVQLPNSVHFVVANSLVKMEKAATSDFNQRVVECRIACRLLAKKLNFTNWEDMTQFAVLHNSLGCTLEEFELTAKQILHKDVYIKDEIQSEFNITSNKFESDFLTPNTQDMKSFKLRQRALHVIQESIRVKKFRGICESNNNDILPLSELMNQSHSSLRCLYECSHPNLDELVRICNENAIGARLTGAGWGGCIIGICDSIKMCNLLINTIKEKYYKHLLQARECNLDDVIFITSPKAGAEILFYKKTSKLQEQSFV